MGRVADSASPTAEDLKAAVAAVMQLTAALSTAKPRELAAVFGTHHILLTDGACEPQGHEGLIKATAGAVLVAANGKCLFFGLAVPRHVCLALGADTTDFIIQQIELLPIRSALWTFREILRGCAFVGFVDNEGARHAVIGAYTRGARGIGLVDAIGNEIAELQAHPWWARVPSPSNLADAPSRLDFEDLRGRGAREAIVSGPDGACLRWQALVRLL